VTLDSIGKLLSSICIHWPAQKKHYLNPVTGNVSKIVAEEWYKRMGFLDDEKVEELFTQYLTSDDVKYPPTVGYFLGHKTERKSSHYWAPRNENRYRVSKRGELIDQEGRVYADPEDPEGIFYINASGHLCKKDVSGQEIVWYR